MTQTGTQKQWPSIEGKEPIRVPTAHGEVLVQLAEIDEREMLIITSAHPPEIPVVRFQSACMFGEALRATDCDCGVQLEAAVKAICAEGGIITYAWEEGRGLGIAGKLRAIALQQSKGIDTAEAFRILGHPPEPRSFDNHVAALRLVHDGTQVRLASANPAKVAALARAGFEVVERLTLEIPTTPERASYLEEKTTSLGHLRCDP